MACTFFVEKWKSLISFALSNLRLRYFIQNFESHVAYDSAHCQDYFTTKPFYVIKVKCV